MRSSDLAVGHTRTALGWAAGAGLFMGIALLAGHPQSAMFVFYGSIAFALFRYFTGDREQAKRRLGALAGILAVFTLVAAGLAAAQLLPSLEYMRLSTRAGLGIDATGGGLTPYDLLQLVLPQVGAPLPHCTSARCRSGLPFTPSSGLRSGLRRS